MKEGDIESNFTLKNQDKAILAAMAPAGRSPFTPVQIQKLMFLIDQELSDWTDGPYFSFEPYDYGPFDKAVYARINEMADAGYIEITSVPGQRWSTFRTTETGQELGVAELEGHQLPVGKAIETYSNWTRGLPFDELVSAIYKKYPDMKVNSVFNG